jgi:hypothetical protein
LLLLLLLLLSVTHVSITQVILAAVFDLLFSQCDRHGQNLYLKPDGSLVLIDNDQVNEQLGVVGGWGCVETKHSWLQRAGAV